MFFNSQILTPVRNFNTTLKFSHGDQGFTVFKMAGSDFKRTRCNILIRSIYNLVTTCTTLLFGSSVTNDILGRSSIILIFALVDTLLVLSAVIDLMYPY